MEKNLGHATAYGYAKSKGYSGTEEEFAQLMADYASVGQSAAQSAEQAAASATSASGSAATASQAAQTATIKASEAVTAADTATTKASEASQSARTASSAATSASTSAQTATTAASTATTKASEAAASANTATTAKTDAESARDSAAQSASEAAESARTLTIDPTLTQSGQAADAKKTGDEITSLKEDLTVISDYVGKYTTFTGWVIGGYINTNVTTGTTVSTTAVSVSNYAYLIVEVKAGDNFLVSGQGGNASRLWAFTDTEYKLISKTAIVDAQQTNVSLTAESDGYLILNTYTGTSVVYNVSKFESSGLTDGYIDVSRLIKPFGYITTNVNIGEVINVIPTFDGSYCHAVISVTKGDKIRISGDGGNNPRLWAFTDNEYKLISKSDWYLYISDLVLMAQTDGYLIYNSSNVLATTHKPKLELYTHELENAYRTAIDNVNYDYRNKGLDVLSAFTNLTCCGDSLTASIVYTGDDGNGNYTVRNAYKKYPNILGEKIGATVEILATGGATASSWWASYGASLATKTNQLIIVYLGTNGSLTDTLDTDANGDDYTQYADTDTGNYCKIVAKALAVGAKVLLVKPYIGANVFVTNSVIDMVAEKFGVAVVTVPYLSGLEYHAYPDNSGMNTTHYNDLGYSAFADSLIRNVGALSSTMLLRMIPT